MRILTLIIGFAVILIFLTSCSKEVQNSQPSKAMQNLQKFKMATVEYPNEPLPQFALKDDKGVELSPDTMRGKIFIIQGFTYGCSSCAEEIATLSKVYDKYKDKGVDIISLDVVSEKIEDALETKKTYNGGNWHWTIDTDDVAIKLKMASLESTYVIDKEGIIRYKDESISDANVLSNEIEKLV